MAKKIKVKPSRISRLISKALVFVVITLICLIVLKSNINLKDKIYKKVFQNNISFAKINELYQKTFGSSLPLHKENEKQIKLVSTNKLEYIDSKKYKDGVELTVKENYLIPSMDSGLVIFKGEKEGYGNTIIVQRSDNIEVWYSNLKNINIDLYDYIKKGENIGEAEGSKIYLVFQKEGQVLDYQKYI